MKFFPLVLALISGSANAADGESPMPSSGLTAEPAAEAPLRAGGWQEPVTGMRFVKVPKGCFKMGWPKAAPERPHPMANLLSPAANFAADETPRHEVCVDAFWLGQYEIQAGEWEKVMGWAAPAGSGRLPAAGITWEEAKAFARRLGELSGGTNRFRLPTEAEWEYACRAGKDDNPQPKSNQLVEGAWYRRGSGTSSDRALRPQEVGRLASNAWGLHDMLGNVWEWVEDTYRSDAYSRHGLFNPSINSGSDLRVIRGASHRSSYVQIRCSTRSFYSAGEALPQIGLRLVRIPQGQP